MLDSPVLFLIFNRPELTKIVFESIKEVKPRKLYVASDGPRLDIQGEYDLVFKAREIISDINWECEVKLLFRENNLGCKLAVSQAISWFFENEEQGIILEDDCLPNSDFFLFCNTLLNKYKYSDKIWCIGGTNFIGNSIGDDCYYFSRINHIWGWATWRRAWKYYDPNLNFWPIFSKSANWANFWKNSDIKNYWENIFQITYEGKIDTWDYQWTAAMWFHDCLAIIPSVNLIKNIGFGNDATHTKNANSVISNLEAHKLKIKKHPFHLIHNYELDEKVHKQFILPKKNYLKSLLKKISSIIKL